MKLNWTFLFSLLFMFCESLSAPFFGETDDEDPSAPYESLNMTKEEVEGLMIRLYHVIDTNKDGNLDENEVNTYANNLMQVLSDKQLTTEMDLVDTNKDGECSLDELLAAFKGEVGENDIETHKESLTKRFVAADKNGDGKLNLRELGIIINPGRDETLLNIELDEVLAAHDKDSDGAISKSEYRSARTVEGEDDSMTNSDFDQFDKNHDGYLTRDEIKQIYIEEEENELLPVLEDIKYAIGDKEITIDNWLKNINKLCVTSLTDFGDVLRFPHDYNLDLGQPKEQVTTESYDEHTEL